MSSRRGDEGADTPARWNEMLGPNRKSSVHQVTYRSALRQEADVTFAKHEVSEGPTGDVGVFRPEDCTRSV